MVAGPAGQLGGRRRGGDDGPPEGRLIAGNLDWDGYSPARGVPFAPDATTDTFRYMQLVNPRNEITQLDVDLDTGAMSPIQTEYDAAGNLTFDGQYFYQYDACRLVVDKPDPAGCAAGRPRVGQPDGARRAAGLRITGRRYPPASAAPAAAGRIRSQL
ncbi:MAG: hypothetical protein ACF8R7_12300 [Phycisphaerales bacterium JB039]